MALEERLRSRGKSEPTLVVVFDEGAASIGELVSEVRPVCRVVLALCSAWARERTPLLQRLFEVVVGEPREILLELAAFEPDGILTYSEFALRTTQELAERLGLTFHSADTMRALTDKYVQRERLAASGLPIPRVAAVADKASWAAAKAQVGFPAVLKPRWGAGSRDTLSLLDESGADDLVEAVLANGSAGLDPHPSFVLEQYLAGSDCGELGDYVSVESFVQAGSGTSLAVLGKFPLAEPFRETGELWPSALSPAETRDVIAIAHAAIAAVGVCGGFVHTEVKLTPDGPRIIEVNGRVGGDTNSLLQRAAGVSPIRMAAQLALGREVDRLPPAPEQCHFQYNHPAPRQPLAFLGVEGLDSLSSVVGFHEYRLRLRPGTALPGGVGTMMLDQMYGTADNAASAARARVKMSAQLTFRFRGRDGKTLHANGVELHDL